ncbi:hypothetical protein Tco_0104766 [Tanacetum coccineum]
MVRSGGDVVVGVTAVVAVVLAAAGVAVEGDGDVGREVWRWEMMTVVFVGWSSDEEGGVIVVAVDAAGVEVVSWGCEGDEMMWWGGCSWSLKEGQHGQVLKAKSNEAKVKHDIDVIETINIELEHKVAKLLKENETLKRHYKELFDSIKTTRAKTIEHTTSLIAQNAEFKAQLQEKGFAIAALKMIDVNNDLPKPVTTYYLPKGKESACAKPHHMIAHGSSRYSLNDMVHNHYLEEAKKQTQEIGRNSKTSMMPSARSQSTANGSKPKSRINNQKSRNWPASKSSCATTKTVPIAEHSRNSRNFSDSKHFVCSTCQKYVFNVNHDHCVTKFLNEVNSRAKVTSNKTTNRNKPVEQTSFAKKPERHIPKGHRFSIKLTSVVHEKTMTPRSCLRWKSTGKIFKTVGLRWVPTGKIFTSSTTKVDSEPTNDSNEDITNQYECEQTRDVSAGTLNLSAELRIHDHSNEPSSLKLVPKVVPPADKTATSRQELELLFHHHITILRSTYLLPNFTTNILEKEALAGMYSKGTHDGRKIEKSFYQHQDSRKARDRIRWACLTMDDGYCQLGEYHLKMKETNHSLWAISSSVSYEEEINFSVFKGTEEDSVGKPLYSRFIKANDFKGHLIKDCDYYEKKMAREAEFKKQRVFNTGNRMAKPVWNYANRVNRANHFVPRPVQLNAVRANVNTGRAKINTVRENVNSVRQNVNSVRTNINTVRSKQPIPTNNTNSFSPVRPQGNWGTGVKTSVGRPKPDHPLKNMKDRGIFDSGYSGHMTGNKDHLNDFKECKGRSVTFGGSKGYITGKGRIKVGNLEFDSVSFVQELGHFNLFSILQICDKQHKVLFTKTECLVVTPDFKMPDEN